ncbi:MAG: Mpo1-like protein [Bdellovibrio sp.]
MNLEELFRQYEASHTTKGNRICHTIGIPLIILSIILLVMNLTQWALVAFIVGWIFQFIGHGIERSWPEFLTNPIFLIVGPIYFVKKVYGSKNK